MNIEIEQKLDLILQKVENLEKERKFRTEIWDEFSPILRLVMNSGGEKLQDWENAGYFDLLEGVGKLFEEIMKNYTANDLKQLSESIVSILDLLKTLTQGDIVFLASEISEVFHQADKAKPVGTFGLFKASYNKDVQKALGLAVELLERVGKVSKKMKSPTHLRPRIQAGESPKQEKLAALLAPKRSSKQAMNKKNHEVLKKPKIENTSIQGVDLDKEGFLVDHNLWTEDLAKEIAQSLGYKELTDAHWELIKFSRKESIENNATPNMRKICVGCNVTAKEVFVLFPHAPAKSIAKIAGVSKPVGCI